MTLPGVAARLTFFKWKKDPNVVCRKIRWSAFPTSSVSTRHFRFCCPTKRRPMNG